MINSIRQNKHTKHDKVEKANAWLLFHTLKLSLKFLRHLSYDRWQSTRMRCILL